MEQLDTAEAAERERSPESRADIIQLELYKKLDEWSIELITGGRYSQPNDQYRQEFAQNPNSVDMHSKWHQWGIIRHTIMTGRYMQELAPALLNEWFGPEAAETKLGLATEPIDGLSKWDLLRISAPTHDLGKFTKRNFKQFNPDGSRWFNFKDHEAESGAIVRDWADRFHDLGMTDDQIEYVARCAELHFELAILRDAARDEPEGITIAFTETPKFEEMAHQIIQKFPDMAREIGIFFIADSLAKTDLHHTVHAQTDEEAEAARPAAQAELAQRGLPGSLDEVVVQMGANMAISHRYLGVWRDSYADRTAA